MGGHQGTEYRLIMTVICAVCALGPLSAVFPIVDHYAGIGFGVLAGLLVVASLCFVGREVRRELLFRAEMRALDRRDAAWQNRTVASVVHRVDGGRR